jgi:antitoxin component of RelBE/YafQ-DinJ toxin-antitoxin module
MSDAMVTARMGVAKKAAGSAVLEGLGISASSAINALFDYLIAFDSMPDLSLDVNEQLSLEEQLSEALEWFNSVDLTKNNIKTYIEGSRA